MNLLQAALRSNANDETASLRRMCDLLAVAMIATAFYMGARTTWGLTLPYDPDHFRDLAFAQTALDGHPLTDASYQGEWIWYNPLVPWLVAVLAWAFRCLPAVAHVTSGAVLNLLGPVGFYALCVRLAGRPAACVSLAISLFLLCSENCWACATYSPWLFTSTFSQGLFYVSALALLRASTRDTRADAVAAGLLAGLTFLSHTAPAILLAVIALAILKPRLWVPCGVAAAVVALPYALAIAGHYHLKVVNPAPLHWEFGPLLPAAIPGTLRVNAHWVALGLAGIAWHRSRLVLCWLVGSVMLMASSLTPFTIVPVFHFWIYVLAGLTLLAGITVTRLLRSPSLAIALVLAVVALRWPAYVGRQDFTLVRGVATGWDPNFARMTATLRARSEPDTVVLGTRGAANLIIGPAGRKVVAPQPDMANPYVPIGARLAAREAMLAAVQRHDATTFLPLANRYGVSMVVSVGEAECAAADSFEGLAPIERHGNVCLSEVGRAPSQ